LGGLGAGLAQDPSSKASTALLDARARLDLGAPVWWSWGRALIVLSFKNAPLGNREIYRDSMPVFVLSTLAPSKIKPNSREASG
jgi:hypothetical protein